MKITARMIADRIGSRLTEARILADDMSEYESVRLLFPDENTIEPGMACIIDSRQISSLAGLDKTNLLICQQPAPIGLPCPVICCQGSIGEIYDMVLTVFAMYAALEDELKEGLLNDWDLQRMLAPLARFFANPVQVYAPIFKAIASVKPEFNADGSVCGTINYEQIISAEIVHGMLRSTDLRQDIKTGSAHYCRYPVFDCGCFQVNLLNNEKLVGRLVLIEEFRPFTPGAADTLNAVAKYIRHLMIHRRSPISSSLFTVEYSISEILGGRITDTRIIDSLMSAIAWPAKESFSILFVSLSSQDVPTQDLTSYHIQALGDLMPSPIVLPMDDGIVALIRTKLLSAALLEDLLEPYLSTMDIYAGIGEAFNDFHSARTCYLQARAAVRLGTESKAPGHVFRYQDTAVDHMVKIVIESGYGPTFIHPAVMLIADYDRENQTDLLATLRTYLQTQCNQVASAQKLHIHRNSLKYRLQQINEIAGLDLRSTNQHLRLHLSILIRDHL